MKCREISANDPGSRKHTGGRSFRRTAGAVEGMPLQLMIMVIVSVLVVSIISGWIYIMSDTDPMLDRIVVEPDEVRITGAEVPVIRLSVLSTEGLPVEGAVVAIEGCGVDIVTVLSEGEGTIFLDGLELPYNHPAGYISITAQRSGMGSRTRDIVVFRPL